MQPEQTVTPMMVDTPCAPTFEFVRALPHLGHDIDLSATDVCPMYLGASKVIMRGRTPFLNLTRAAIIDNVL